MSSRTYPSRRTILRGSLQGVAVSMGLPLLDCFLNANGTALASGEPLPRVFATWFWGCGLSPDRWVPATAGANYTFGAELAALEPFKSRTNVYSGLKVHLDGKPNQPHSSGPLAIYRGSVPRERSSVPSVDSLIGDHIGATTRFRSIEVAACGTANNSHSGRGGAANNPAETSPAALYTRMFGPEFQDPNVAEFKVDPKVLARHSILSAVADQRRAFAQKLGAADRARLDQYFTSTRAVEQQLEIMMQKPAPMPSCSAPAAAKETATGTDIEIVRENHRLLAQLLAHAVACDQTRVVNVAFSEATSTLRKAGETTTHHILTHEEAVDANLQYQPRSAFFGMQAIEGLKDFAAAFDSIREGNQSLLDRTIIMASTDTGYAKMHTIENIPMLTIGGGNGLLKTGLHVRAPGDAASRLGFTLQQVYGVATSSWGTESMNTSKAFTEILA